jgi:hypothetical protein
MHPRNILVLRVVHATKSRVGLARDGGGTTVAAEDIVASRGHRGFCCILKKSTTLCKAKYLTNFDYFLRCFDSCTAGVWPKANTTAGGTTQPDVWQ